jgi:hypothetical protein
MKAALSFLPTFCVKTKSRWVMGQSHLRMLRKCTAEVPKRTNLFERYQERYNIEQAFLRTKK